LTYYLKYEIKNQAKEQAMLTAAAITEITATIPAISDRAPTANMARAYALGQKYAHIHEDDALDAMTGNESDFYCGTVEDYQNIHIAYLAGRAGTEPPTWQAGWRYGDMPACGQSRNHVTGDLEWGVSMMAVRDCGETGDFLSATFCASGREVRYYAGWLVTHTAGSDGEPLLVACRPIH
jgi:hypothetical protein